MKTRGVGHVLTVEPKKNELFCFFFPDVLGRKPLDFGATPFDTHPVTESAGLWLQKFEEWKESSF